MKLTNCNTLEKVVCGCTLSFSSFVASSISVLDVGNLVGGSCSFSAYVIDWYRNGVKEMVSGTQNSEPEVTAIHPFTGNAAIPVLGGTWVPVVRWVVLNGEKIYSVPTKCRKWCDTLTGLPSVNVDSIGCGIVRGSPGTGYETKIAYVSTQDYTLAARTIQYFLASDLSTRYVVVKFAAYTVADRIKIFWKNETTPLYDVAVGSALTTNVNISPKTWGGSELKINVVIPENYSAGDYLTI